MKILFGSQARGDATEHSDEDVCTIEFGFCLKQVPYDYGGISNLLFSELQNPPEHLEPFVWHLLREGRIIEASPEELGVFEALRQTAKEPDWLELLAHLDRRGFCSASRESNVRTIAYVLAHILQPNCGFSMSRVADILGLTPLKKWRTLTTSERMALAPLLKEKSHAILCHPLCR